MLQQLKQVKSQLSDLIGAFDGSEKCHIWYGGGTATTTATTATTTTTTSMMMSGDRRSDELQKSLGSLKTSLQALQEPTIAKTDTAEKRVLLNRYLQQVRDAQRYKLQSNALSNALNNCIDVLQTRLNNGASSSNAATGAATVSSSSSSSLSWNESIKQNLKSIGERLGLFVDVSESARGSEILLSVGKVICEVVLTPQSIITLMTQYIYMTDDQQYYQIDYEERAMTNLIQNQNWKALEALLFETVYYSNLATQHNCDVRRALSTIECDAYHLAPSIDATASFDEINGAVRIEYFRAHSLRFVIERIQGVEPIAMPMLAAMSSAAPSPRFTSTPPPRTERIVT